MLEMLADKYVCEKAVDLYGSDDLPVDLKDMCKHAVSKSHTEDKKTPDTIKESKSTNKE